MGKPAQLLQEFFQLDSQALATIIGSFRKPAGFADQMRQAHLLLIDPVAVDRVVIGSMSDLTIYIVKND